MVANKYKLRDKSEKELREWVAEHSPGSVEYTAGIEESMRRGAIMEEWMERKEAPVWRREFIAIGIAILALVTAICTIVTMYK